MQVLNLAYPERNISKIIIALDFNNQKEVLEFIAPLNPILCRLKVGKELFISCGPQLVENLLVRGFDVFLDLKFHDIPNTVYAALKASANLGVWMVNVHASGGRKMLERAKSAIDDSETKPLLIAVTILTSLADAEILEIGFNKTVTEQGIHLAKLAYECGLDGVVCSALEAELIKQNTSVDFLAVTPGIRFDAKKVDDQTRIMTPHEAIKNSADYLVIGRPITQAQNPLETLIDINRQLNN